MLNLDFQWSLFLEGKQNKTKQNFLKCLFPLSLRAHLYVALNAKGRGLTQQNPCLSPDSADWGFRLGSSGRSFWSRCGFLAHQHPAAGRLSEAGSVLTLNSFFTVPCIGHISHHLTGRLEYQCQQSQLGKGNAQHMGPLEASAWSWHSMDWLRMAWLSRAR